MGGGSAHAFKRIPRIKFPIRHSKQSTSDSSSLSTDDALKAFLSRSGSSNTALFASGKASDQPKRTPVSNDEIEAILLDSTSIKVLQPIWGRGSSLMGDGPRTIEIIPNYFDTSASAESPLPRSSDTSVSGEDSPRTSTSASTSHQERNSASSNTSANRPRFVQNCSSTRKTLRTASFMLRLFSLKGLRNIAGLNGEEKVELSAVELESLRSELTDLEEREAHLKAQLEHLDEILRSARLTGYLYMRTRWAALPGELPPIDDCDVDDWVPRFTVLQGSCIFFYLSSTDLSPQDSAVISDIVEVGPLPCLDREDEDTWHCFYIVTRYGLRIECASASEIQVDSWLRALRTECKFEADKTDSVDQNHENSSQICTEHI